MNHHKGHLLSASALGCCLTLTCPVAISRVLLSQHGVKLSVKTGSNQISQLGLFLIALMEKCVFFGGRSQRQGELLWSDGLPQTRSNQRDSPCISKLLLPVPQIHQRGAGCDAGQEASYSCRPSHTHIHRIERSTQTYLWKWNLCSRRLDHCLHVFPLTEIKWHLFSVATMHGKCFKTQCNEVIDGRDARIHMWHL